MKLLPVSTLDSTIQKEIAFYSLFFNMWVEINIFVKLNVCSIAVLFGLFGFDSL